MARLTRVLAIGVILPLLLLTVPTSCLEKYPSICLFKNIAGFDCIGCGMTRAISSMLHGEAQKAYRYNKLVVIVFPLLAYSWMTFLFREWDYFRKKQWVGRSGKWSAP